MCNSKSSKWMRIGILAISALLWSALPVLAKSIEKNEGEPSSALSIDSKPQQGVVSQQGVAFDPDRNSQVVGGEEAAPYSFPWTVALVEAGEDPYWGQFCGGTLIHPAWVLTAAHCVTDDGGTAVAPQTLEVYVGLHYLDAQDGERIQVQRVVIHDSYDPYTSDSDIALLQLKTASQFATVSPLRPSQTALASPSTMAKTLGWGSLDSEGYDFPDTLQVADVPIVSNETCNSWNSYGGDVTPNMICAGYRQGGKDACYGDSGGPLVVPNAGGTGWLLAGVTSWGDGCAEPDKYGVYTRVSNFSPWIDSYVTGSDETGPRPYHRFDVDANGKVDGDTDGVLIYRYMRGIRGARLIRNRLAPDATRTTAVEIEAYLEDLIWGSGN